MNLPPESRDLLKRQAARATITSLQQNIPAFLLIHPDAISQRGILRSAPGIVIL
jgi:hypothetical protein